MTDVTLARNSTAAQYTTNLENPNRPETPGQSFIVTTVPTDED